MAYGADGWRRAITQGAPKKKNTKKTREEKTISKNNRPTSFFFFFLGAPCVGCGPSVDMPLHVGTRSWLRGLPFELVPSDDPFMWCFYETFFFLRKFFIFPTDFVFLRARN
jgi:hypothetical protein